MSAKGEGFLEANCDALGMDAELRERLLNSAASPDVELGMQSGGRPRFRYRGEDLYDPTDPMGRIAAQIASVDIRPSPDAIVFFGFGMGIHAEIIRRKCDLPIVVFEPRIELLRAALACRPIALEDVHLVTSIVRLMEVVDGLIDAKDRRIAVAVLPEYRLLFGDELVLFSSALERTLVNLEIRAQTLKRAPEWIANMIVNLPKLASRRSASELEGAFRGVPGIFVGAGPSLDESLDALREAQDRAVIIGANASLRPLISAGIVPELVANIEAAELRRHFEGIASLDRVVLAACANVHPLNLDFPFKDILHATFVSSPEADWYETAFGIEPLSSGGSVACAIFSILHRLGCDPIIAVGMDLAFSDSKVHAAGSDPTVKKVRYDAEKKVVVSDDEAERRSTSYRAETVRALGGEGEVLTMDILSSYRTWFETAAATWARDRRLINATAKGARIEGFEELPLREAIARYGAPRSDLKRRLGEAIAAIPPHDNESLARALEDDIFVLEEVRATAIVAMGAVDRALARIGASDLEGANLEMALLSDSETALRETSRRSRLLNMALMTATQEIRRGRFDDENADVVVQTAKSLERSRLLFSKIAESAEDLVARFLGVVVEIRRVGKSTGSDEDRVSNRTVS